MRKEVKLGLAIGGVLLAVLIVYVLAVSGGSEKKQVAQADGAAAGGGNVSLEPVDGDTPGTAPVPPAAPPTQYDPPPGGATDPFAPTPRAGAAAPSDAQASGTSRKDDWNRILNDQLVLMTETPQVVGGARGAAAPAEAAAAPPAVTSVESAAPAPVEAPVPAPRVEAPAAPTVSAPAAEPVAPAPPVPPTVQPSDATTAPPAPTSAAPAPVGREYIVQAGETLSSISAAVYGNANFYPHILRANPNINPDRIRPGTKIILPDISTVRPASSEGGAAAGSSSSAAPLDASRQYRVQPGDSLHKIALRLYGDSVKSESLYQLNKQTIGADPHRLKVGQVLSLPDPPTAR